MRLLVIKIGFSMFNYAIINEKNETTWYSDKTFPSVSACFDKAKENYPELEPKDIELYSIYQVIDKFLK